MITQSIVAAAPEEKEFKFAEKTQWMIPRQRFILAKLSKKKLRKLAKWLKTEDDVAVHILGSSGELFLLNESMSYRRRKRKHV